MRAENEKSAIEVTLSRKGERRMKKMAGVVVAILLFVSVFLHEIPAYAAVPELGNGCSMKGFLIADNKNEPVYADPDFTVRGTASPYRKYAACIYPTDEMIIREINIESSYAYVSYMTSSGYRSGYIRVEAICANGALQGECRESSKSITTYKRPNGDRYGSIFVGDEIYKLSELGDYVQLVYQISGGYKVAWVTKDAYSKAVVTSYEPQGVVDEISLHENVLHIRGWCFDRDRIGESISLHVYVGGPAGDDSAFAAYQISTYRYRPDVKNVYGTGNYTGFEEHISLEFGDREGPCGVYVYAINESGNNPLIGSGAIMLGDDNSSETLKFENLVGKSIISDINSPCYTTKNISYLGGYKGQCTWFAYGRFLELHGINLRTAPHAKEWLRANASDSRVRITTEIQAKSIAVKDSGKYGHVIIVEHVSFKGGKPYYVYYTECNADADSSYTAGRDAIVKKMPYADFSKNIAGYITAK